MPVLRKVANARQLSFARMIRGVADRFGTLAAARWTKAVIGYQAQINMRALENAIRTRNIAAIERVVAATQLQIDLAKAVRGSLAATVQGAGTGATSILNRAGVKLKFDAPRAAAGRHARARAASLTVGIPKQTRAIIAEVVAMGAERGLTAAQQARAIREVVGLPPNWAKAPTNFGNELRAAAAAGEIGEFTRKLSGRDMVEIRAAVEGGRMTEDLIEEMEERYAEHLIMLRSLTIARTETLVAAHAGLQEAWAQAKELGLLPDTARQFWIVTPDDRLCPICVEIPGMNPDGRALDEDFETPEGPVDAPPAPHPNCRCTISLAFPGEEEEET